MGDTNRKSGEMAFVFFVVSPVACVRQYVSPLRAPL